MAFLADEDFEDLPDDDEDAFSRLERVSRSRLMNMKRDQHDNLPFEALAGYMNEITSLAGELKIPGLTFSTHEESNIYWEFAEFTRSVESILVGIRMRRARRDRRNSVALSGPGRERIQHYLEKLKEEVLASNIADARKGALLDKIADFEAELSRKRFNMAVAFGVVALVVAAVNDMGGSIDHLSKLAHSITTVFGDEKAREEEQQRQLPSRAPFRAIPDMNKGRRDQGKLDLSSVDDDDIPF